DQTKKNNLLESIIDLCKCFCATRCTTATCIAKGALIRHFIHCDQGNACTYSSCASARPLIHHWKSCKHTYCRACISIEAATGQTRMPPPQSAPQRV
ncbi:hypothetical protein PMAYCL1PPCAC_10278, partial [Pristionchus mayeri]